MTTTYHHGSLRDALLLEGRRQLFEEGPQAITMRGLAKRVGVSHSAPLRHFADRDALLDAIAAQGFDELATLLGTAELHADLRDRLSAYAHGHVDFALDNGPLMDLMFSGGARAADSLAAQSAQNFFAVGKRMLGEEITARPGPLPYLLAGTLEGISSLVSSGRLSRDQVDEVTDAAVRLMLPAIEQQVHPQDR